MKFKKKSDGGKYASFVGWNWKHWWSIGRKSFDKFIKKIKHTTLKGKELCFTQDTFKKY